MGIQIREKKLADGRISLYLDVYHAGQRAYEFLEIYLTKDRQANKESMQLAESIKAKRVLELQNSDHGFIPAFQKKANFIAYFEKKANERTKRTGEESRYSGGDLTYIAALKHLKAFAGDSVHFSAINEQWLEEFKKYLLTKMKQITAHTYFAKVKAVLHQAKKDKIILINPADNVSNFPKPDVEKVFLNIEEIRQLEKATCSHPDVKRAFLFCCYTGLRFSDMSNLKWRQLDGDRLVFTQKKTGVLQYHPLNLDAKRLIFEGRQDKTLPMPDSYIFRDLVCKGHAHLYLKDWVKNAKITKHVTFHSSRHTYATLLVTSGVDLYTVSKLLGHSQISTTQIYAKVIDQKKIDAVNSMPQIGGMA